MQKSSTLTGFSTLFSAAFLYATTNIFFRLIGYNLPLYFQNFVRSVFMSLILLVPAIYFKKWKKLNKNDIPWIIARTIGGVVALIAYYIAINFLKIGTTYFLFYASSTISGYIGGKLLFNEKLNARKIISLLLSIFGLTLVYSISVDAESFLYIILAMIAGVGFAFWTTFAKKISGTYSAIQLNLVDNVISAICFCAVSIIIREVWIVPDFSKIWLANYGLGIIFIFTGQLVVYGFRHLEAQIGSLVMLSEILFGLIVGVIFYKEIISLPTFIGGALIIVAAILPKLNFKKLNFTKKLKQV